MKVLLCDDNPSRCTAVRKLIDQAGAPKIEVIPLAGKDLYNELVKLFERVNKCVSRPDKYSPEGQLLLDQADVVAIDNNLAELEIKGARITAESIAGYVRAFTSSAYVVSLNKNPDVDFDLRFLMGDYTSRADLVLNAHHLSNKGLWTGNPGDSEDSFKPFYWPALATMAKRRRSQIDFVRRNMAKRVLRSFGFSDAAITQFSPHARASLSPQAESETSSTGIPIEDLTFLDVFKDGDRSLYIRSERLRLSHSMNNSSILDVISRAVASDLDRWFRRDIVGPQDVLVDLPHLLQRFPMLLGNKSSKISDWDKASAATRPPYNLDSKIYAAHLARALFKRSEWLSAPSFDWHLLKNDERLNELYMTADPAKWIDGRFCEDTSTFSIANDKENSPEEFATEFEGSWQYRYVKKVRNKKYRPQSRFAR